MCFKKGKERETERGRKRERKRKKKFSRIKRHFNKVFINVSKLFHINYNNKKHNINLILQRIVSQKSENNKKYRNRTKIWGEREEKKKLNTQKSVRKRRKKNNKR